MQASVLANGLQFTRGIHMPQFKCHTHEHDSIYLHSDERFEWYWCKICRTHWVRPRSV